MKKSFKRVTIFLLSALLVICLWPSAVFAGEGGGVSAFAASANLTPTTVTFPAAAVGYGEQTANVFEFENTGDEPLTDMTESIAGKDDDAFVITSAAIGSPLAAGATASISVRPATGLSAGTYTASLVISCDELEDAAASLSFTVNPIVDAAGPVITMEPQDKLVKAATDLTVDLTVAATAADLGASAGALSYQWNVWDPDQDDDPFDEKGGEWIAANGASATAATYKAPADTAGTSYYKVIVTNTNDSVNGNKTATADSRFVTVVVTDDTPVTVTWNAGAGASFVDDDGKVFATNTWVMNYAATAIWEDVFPSVVRAGFDQTGPEWHSNKNLKAPVNKTANITAITVYAKWSADTYGVDFDANDGTIKMLAAVGGAVVSKMTVQQTFNANYKLPPNPTRGGWKFDGWFANAGFTGAKITNKTKVPANVDKTILYAKWVSNTYNIKFDANGGNFDKIAKAPKTTTIPTKVVQVAGVDHVVYDFPADPPVRDGWKFIGWSTKKNALTTEVSELTNFKNHTLFALWEGAVHYAVFDAIGGTAVDVSFPTGFAQTYTGTWPALGDSAWPVAKPNLTGATDRRVFQGWSRTVKNGVAGAGVENTKWTQAYTAANMTIVNDAGPSEGALGVKLFARYGSTATINYNADGGTVKGIGKSVSTAVNTKFAALPNPTKAGYKFDGWYVGGKLVNKDTYVWSDNNVGNTANPIGSGAFVLADLQDGGHGLNDLVITAKWTKNPFNVTLNANGGTIVTGSSPIKGVLGDTKLADILLGSNKPADPKPKANAAASEFLGWSVKKNGPEIKDDSLDVVTKNVTVYARWTTPTKNIVFDGNGGLWGSDKTKKTADAAPGLGLKHYDIYGIAMNWAGEPKRTGFTFDGWSDKKTKGKLIEYDAPIDFTGATQTLYALWIPNTTRNITFDVNGANGGRIVNPANGAHVTKLNTYRAQQNKPYGEGWYSDKTDANGLPEVVPPENAAQPLAFDGWWTAKTKTAKGAVQVTDATVMSIAKNHTLWAQWKIAPEAAAAAPKILTTDLESVNVGEEFLYPLAVSGDAPITWELVTSPTPDPDWTDWLNINKYTGVLYGIAPEDGDEFEFTVKAANGYGSDSAVLTLEVSDLSYTAAFVPAASSYTFPTVIAKKNGEDWANDAKAQVFTIKNTGTGTLTGLGATVTPFSGFDIDIPLSRNTLVPGATATVSVCLEADLVPSDTAYAGTLTISGTGLTSIAMDLSATVTTAPVGVTGVKAVTGDGTEGPTNVGKYTVGALTGTAPNYEVMVTASEPLIPYASDDEDQGEGKWIGVLITLGIDLVKAEVGAPGDWEKGTAEDVAEARSAGATDDKTLVWWLKSENIGAAGRTIQIKEEGAPDSTAVSVTVKFTEWVEVVDTDEYDTLVLEVGGLVEADYTSGSWASFQTAIGACALTLTAVDGQAKIDAEVIKIKAALALLVPVPVNTEEYDALILDVKGLVDDDYTLYSWGLFETAIETCDLTLTAEDGQAKINAEVSKIKAALALLVQALGITEEYDTLVQEAEELVEEEYTPESWALYEKAIDECNLTLTSADKQSVIDAEVIKIKTALALLVEID